MKRPVRIIIMFLLLGTLTACAETQHAEKQPVRYSAEEPLMTLADSRDEAEKIADAYEIELVNYSNGVATFFTEQDPTEVIRRGKELGLPELSINALNSFN